MGLADYIKLGSFGFKPSEIRGFKDKGIATEQVIRLAENGYSVTDINELIALDGADGSLQPGNEGQTNPAGPQGTPETTGAAAESDYMKQLEAQAKEMEELKKQLAAAQAQNSTKNLAGAGEQKTSRDIMQDALRALY